MVASTLPDFFLVAASRWVTELARVSFAQAARLFRESPVYRDFTPSQYQAAVDWLFEAQILQKDGVNARLAVGANAVSVLEHFISATDPIWLRDADFLIETIEDIPLDVAELSASCGFSPNQQLLAIRTAWGKVDLARRAEIGLAGEEYFVRWLRQNTTAHVVHASLADDSLGYDVSASAGSQTAKFEVKTTVRKRRVVFFLSRNEFEHMKLEPGWALQIVVLSGVDPQLFTIDSDWLLTQVPRDINAVCRWESARIQVPASELVPGISESARWLM